MDHLLLLLLLLWSSGLRAEEQDNSTEYVRLMGGATHCSGSLQFKLGEWISMDPNGWTLRDAAAFCSELNCGSAVSLYLRELSSDTIVTPYPYPFTVEITCSDSVRLVNGTSSCSGRLEVKSDQWWSSVCEADFDQLDAEVVCRELGCGVPSVLQGGLYGAVEAPRWSKEFQCEGHESGLLDCRSSDSARSSCSPVGLTCSEPVRLVGGASRCSGVLQVKLGEWRPVNYIGWSERGSAVVCRELNCGSAVSTGIRVSPSNRTVKITPDCVLSGLTLRECIPSSGPYPYPLTVEITCSDSVRLVNGTSPCSGRLEVKSDQWWSSVCEADFDQLDAEVVCRELDCGVPSVLQGGLYGAVEAPRWSKEFQCEGHESGLLDCRSSDSARSSCSPVGLTCSEHVRLVGGASRCSGVLQVKLGEWTPVSHTSWTLKETAVVCRELNCGSAVSTGIRVSPSNRTVWIRDGCVLSGLTLRECILSSKPYFYPFTVEITCSDSVRLVNGTSSCSGRLEVKSDQWWSSVCEADFDQLDAEVVCRELGCGVPSVLQGGLYGAVEAPRWSKEFQCEGHESALLDCRSSDSARSSCSPIGLTCSEPVRLVGGASRCSGVLQVKLGEWRPVNYIGWSERGSALACRELNCGSAVSTGSGVKPTQRSVRIIPGYLMKGITLKECSLTSLPSDIFHSREVLLTCSDSVRLVNGTSPCSGRLEVKSDQWWSSVCEADFDQLDAEVVCRELDCGVPSVLQGGLYGAVEAPRWSKEFQCEGHESGLLDCRSSDSARSSCSPVRLTCSGRSGAVRLVGGASRCSGVLQGKLEEWTPVLDFGWTLKEAAVVCRELNCGSAVSTESIFSPSNKTVLITPECVLSGLTLRECILSVSFPSQFAMELTCSDLLVQPVISMWSSVDRVSEAQQQGYLHVFMGSNFTISCSIRPQYPGGLFQLTFTSSSINHTYTQPAVNHSTTFLFPAAELDHQGSYSCVYHIYVLSRNFSSESLPLCLTVTDPTGPVIRLVVLPLTLLLVIAIVCLVLKVSRGQRLGPQEAIELDSYNLGVSRIEGEPDKEEGVQVAE